VRALLKKQLCDEKETPRRATSKLTVVPASVLVVPMTEFLC